MEVDEESDSEDEADFGINDASCADTSAIKESLATFSSSNSQNERSLFRCIMCEKVFRHSDNLKVHLQSHLGTRAKLNSCGLCRRSVTHGLERCRQISLHPSVQQILLNLQELPLLFGARVARECPPHRPAPSHEGAHGAKEPAREQAQAEFGEEGAEGGDGEAGCGHRGCCHRVEEGMCCIGRGPCS